MAWNQRKPDDSKPDADRPDPWGNKRRPDREPPDMDDFLEKLIQACRRLLTGTGDFRLLGMVLPALLGIIVVSGFYQVEPGGKAVVSRFGHFHGIAEPGLHWRVPLIDTVRGADMGSTREMPLNIELITADENMVNVSVHLQYRVTDVQHYFGSMADPESALAHVAEASLHKLLGGHSLSDLLGPDHAGATAALPALQEEMDRYQSGITVTGIKLGDIGVPRDSQAAYADITAANQELLASKNKANADADRMETAARTAATQEVADAQAYQREVVDHAQAEADRFGPLLAEYKKSREVVRNRLYLDTMQSVLGRVTTVVVADKGINPSIYLPAEKGSAAAPAVTGAPVHGGKP